MDKAILKQKMLSGVLWQTFERFGLQGFTFLLQLILARLLLPDDFGIVVLLDVFIQISWCFIDSGFSASMIQCREATERDFSGIYWLSQGVALIFYLGLFIAAPAIARFYKLDQLTPMLRIGGLNSFFVAHSSVCLAIICRKLKFRNNFFISVPAMIIGGLAGILLAYCGYGAWSLIWMQLTTSICRVLFGIYQTHWMPGFSFNAEITKKMFMLGYNLLIINVVNTLCNNMPSFVIGKLFPAAQLGFYAKAKKIPFFFAQGLRSSITGTVFSALSAEQNDVDIQRKIVIKSVIASSFLLFPSLAFMMGAGKTMVLVLLGSKWLPIVPYLRITALSFCFFAFQGINNEVIIANGKGKMLLKIEITNKIIFVLLFIIGVFFGMNGILWSMVITSLIAFYIYANGCVHILGLSFLQQLGIVKRLAFFAVITGFAVYGVGNFKINEFILLPIQCILGAVVYLGLNFLFNHQQSMELIRMLQPMLSKLKNATQTTP